MGLMVLGIFLANDSMASIDTMHARTICKTMGCSFSIYSLFMDIHNSFKDIHNSFMDIHNSFKDIHLSFMDIHNSFKDIHK